MPACSISNASPASRRTFRILNYSAVQNAIVYNDSINSSGARSNKPVNANGIYNLMANVDSSFRIKKLNTRMNWGSPVNANYNRSVNFINDERNKTVSLSR